MHSLSIYFLDIILSPLFPVPILLHVGYTHIEHFIFLPKLKHPSTGYPAPDIDKHNVQPITELDEWAMAMHAMYESRQV